MRAQITILHSELSGEREVFEVRRRRRLATLAPKGGLPCICIVNGTPVLRAKRGWLRCVGDGDMVVFIVRPQGMKGGGVGSIILKIVLTLALAVASVYSGGALTPLLGLQVGTMAATLASAAIAGVITVAGTMLINALIGSPKAPTPLRLQAQAGPSPTYSIGAQGNRARIGEVVPEIFGRHLVYPDFGAEPYTEFAGNEQYLYQLFVIGRGHYDIEDLRIEDTAVANFPEVTYELVPPGDPVTLFPVNVTTANEVSGQELLTNVAAGPFVLNPAGSPANALAIDVVTPRGLYYANDAGGLDAVSVTFRIEARQIDAAGAPVAPGTWTVLGTHTLTDASSTPMRRSYRYSVASGRYEMKATRTDTKSNNSRVGHEINWTAARAYIPGGQSYPDVTVLAMRLRASNSLSQQSARKINLIAKRKLPVWNGTSWSAPTHTRSIAWALAYMCKTRMPDKHFDLAWLLAKDATWAARGDRFDALFDAEMTFGEALTLTTRAGRSRWYQHGHIIRFFRDEPASLPVAVFTMRNTVRGSFKTDYLMSGDETADAVIVEYFDEASWGPKEVLCQLPGGNADKPARVKLFGVTSRDQAWREGMYEAAGNRYRRIVPSFTTEMEGFIPMPGDLIAIQRDRPGWGQSGEVLDWVVGTKTLTLSEPLVWGTGAHYFGFRKRDGSFSGPLQASAGADDYHAVLTLALDFVPDVDLTRERTAYIFGASTNFYLQARVVSPKPRSLERVELICVNEDAAVHTADTGTAPPVSATWNLPARITMPVVDSINVTLGGNARAPQLQVSWDPAPGADHYYVEWSYSGGQSWQRAGMTSTTNAVLPAQRGTVKVRVAGVGLAAGGWTEWTGDPFAAPPPDVATFLISAQPDGTRQFDMALAGPLPPDFSGYAIRYRLGSGWTSYDNDLAPLHAGILTASPYETNQLAAGVYTFAVKAVDDSGHVSANATFIQATLPDPRMAGVLVNVQPHLSGWPGAKTSCAIDPGTTSLIANDTTTWAGLTTWTAWARWNVTPAGTISYEHSAIDLGVSLPFVPLVYVLATGTVVIDEQHSNDNVTYTAYAAAGPLVTARYIRIRVTVTGSFPLVQQMDIKLSGEPILEDLADINTAGLTGSYRIGVGDIRVPIKKTYSIIRQASVAALQNVGAGWSWVLIDKDTTVGPRIKIYNASNALADAVIDVHINGS